ncbi:MAG: Txe/YoeB family addiction module toxin [Mariprofundales bacterium]
MAELLKPCLSRQARSQIGKLTRSNPTLLNQVMEAITRLVREPHTGLHKPKPLVGRLKGYWSVRLNRKDRLIYRVEGGQLLIASVEGHYDDH